MTINVTTFGAGWVMQAADRQLSADGQPSGQINKTIVFVSDRLRLSAVFAGFAEPDGYRSADMWLCEALAEVTPTADLAEALTVIAKALNERWAKLPPEWKDERFLVTLAGWDLAYGIPVHGRVSNCIDGVGELCATLTSFVAQPSRASGAHVVGSVDPSIRRDEESKLCRVARLGRSEDRIAWATLGAIRRAHASAPNLVSADATMIWLPDVGDATSAYWPKDGGIHTVGPGYVQKTSAGGFIIAGAIGVGRDNTFTYGNPATPASVRVSTDRRGLNS